MPQTSPAGRSAPARVSADGVPMAVKSFNANHVLLAQISTLVNQLSKKNYRQTSQELSLLSTNYGNMATLAVLRNLFSKIDLKSARDQPKIQLLLQALDTLSQRTNFVSLICQAFEDLEPLPHDFLHKLSKGLKLTTQQDLMLGVSLLHSHRPISKSEGLKFLKSKLIDLPTLVKEQLPESLLHELVQAIHNPNFDAKLREHSLRYLHQLYKSLSIDPMPHILTLLAEDESTLEMRQTGKTGDMIGAESNAVLKQIVSSLGPAQVMQDIGYSCCQEEATLKVLLRQFGRVLDESKVARILGMMCITHKGLEDGISLSLYDNALPLIDTATMTTNKATTWNLDTLTSVLSVMCPKLDWLSVMHNLDYPEFSINDLEGFNLLTSVYFKATSQQFPTHILLPKWRNLAAQLSMIKLAFEAYTTSKVPNVSRASIATLSHFEHLNALQSTSPSPLCTAFSAVDLINALLNISEESGYYAPVAQFLETGRSYILLLSLVESKSNAMLKEELVSQLTSQLLMSNSEENPLKWSLLQRIWQLNPLAIVDTMINLYNKSPENMDCILECGNILGLNTILNLVPYTLFAMELAIRASQMQILDLNAWIQSMVTEHTDVFVRSILQYIHSRMDVSEQPHNVPSLMDTHRSMASGSTGGLSEATMLALLSGIKMNESLLSQEAKDELAQLLPQSVQTTKPNYPTSLNASTNSTGNAALSEVELEADHYFQQVYEHRISTDSLLEQLRNLKSSSNAKDQQILTCMINNLFAECAFFSSYPDTELQVTAALFGGLIHHQILDGDEMNTALQTVRQSLQQPGDRLNQFGTSVISHIGVQRLSQWPKFAASLLEFPHLGQVMPQHLLTTIRLAANAASPLPITQLPNPGKGTASAARGSTGGSGSTNNTGNRGSGSNQSSGGGSGGQSQGSGASSGSGGAPPPGGGGSGGSGSGSGGGDGRDTGASLSLGTLVASLREVEQPDEETRDRIHFILNNVSATNMNQKAVDLSKCLKPQFFDYFAAHLVVHRVSTDTRFQALYLELIDLQRQPDLFQKVLKMTYRAVHAILNSPKLTQSTERSLLKNLGTWLGSMTLKRNKPVMHIDLAVKDLILKGYEQGTLFAILPFVSRILLTAEDSKVFRIPNPWFVAILRLLKEIHSHPRAQQNIKFEIELLYQGIGEDLATMPPSETLLNYTMYSGPTMRDFVADSNALSSTANGTASTVGSTSTSTQSSHVPGSVNWMPSLHIQPELQIFNAQPVLKQRLHAAFNKAIDDLLPEAENTVSIVPKTTLRLVLKDFANEPDETKLLSAARSMAQSLASSLLHATLRNHIRNATHQTIKASLDIKTQYETLQPQFHRAIDDNLEVASNILAKHMVEKTMMAVERELRPAVEARVLHREQMGRGLTTRAFSDQSQISSLQSQLPDSLKVRPGVGATAQQTALYDVFLRLPSLIQASMEAATVQQQAQLAAAHLDGKLRPAAGSIASGTGPSGIQPKEFVDPKKVNEKLDAIIGELERWAGTVEGPLEAAPDAQTALGPLPHLTMTILRDTQDRPAAATACALRVMDLLYTNTRSLRGPEPNPMREVYTRILFAIARSTPAVVEALTKRYLSINAGEATAPNSETPLDAYHRELTHWLLSWQLLRCDMLDPALAAEIARGNRPALDFSLWLVKSAILGTHDASGNPNQAPTPQTALPTLLAGNDLSRTLAELETVLSRNRSAELHVVQSCAQVALDVNAQSRRTATHTDQLHQQAKRPTTAASSASQRQQQLLLRQQMLAKTLPQPVVALFSDWVNLWQHGSPSVEHMQQVLVTLRSLGLVSFGDANLAESESHFLRGIIDAAVLAYLMQSQMQAHAQASLQPGVEPTPEQATYLSIQPYAAIDALAKLVVYLAKNYPEPAKISLLQRVLHQTSAATSADYSSNVAEFNQRPYFRLLSSLLAHLSDPSFGDKLESLFLSAFADLLLELRPQQCPGFAFAWLELVSHRLFMPKLIRHPRACFALQKLLIFHLTFLEPYLAAAKLNEAVFSLYQGTLRVFLVLIHDFPEFLCDFHHSFCDVLPPNCIQLRNLILSAFPRNVKLPDPALNIKMEQLPASKESPRVYNIDGELQASGMRERLEEVLKGGDSGPLFSLLPSALFHKDPQQGKPTSYNVKLINSIVLYCGIAAISDPHSHAMDIYLHLANILDAEGRYHLFNAFANQLRYPSSHTHYFSWALLHIFSEATTEAIPEQITRVLLERYIAQKPTPWGLAITYQELTKNQIYNFWSRDFVKASPDMGRLFMNLSRRSNPR